MAEGYNPEDLFFDSLQNQMEARALAGHLRVMYRAFTDSGFAPSEAFELTKLFFVSGVTGR